MAWYVLQQPHRHVFHPVPLYNNNFEGDLSMLSGAILGVVSTAGNPKLCGMVSAAVRWAHGYNPHNTSLGLPCM